MERVKQKLNSRRGASILLAMLLMLVAFFISAVVISAAATAARRVMQDSKEEQEILALDSAAKAMKAYLEKAESYEHYDIEPVNPAYSDYAELGTVSSSSPVMEYFETRLQSASPSESSPVLFTLTTQVTVPADVPEEAFQGTTTMKLLVKEKADVSLDRTTITDYRFTGTVYTGDTEEGSARKVFVSDGVVRRIVVETDDTIDVPIKKTIPNPEYDPENPDSGPETLTQVEDTPVNAIRTTTTWSVAALRLTTIKP